MTRLLLCVAGLLVLRIAAECQNDWVIGQINLKIDGTPTPMFVIQQNGNDGNVSVTANSITMPRTGSMGGPRAYLAKECATAFGPDIFWQAKLLGKTFSYTVDLSKVACGCNAALYTVTMPAYDPNTGEPTPTIHGDYYCE
jgi:hypothetical protein